MCGATIVSVVAIDGPAGAGKSTVARAVAHKLGFAYLDTGAMYRAVALEALERGIDLEDETGLTALTEEVEIDLRENVVLLNGRDVSRGIREERVTAAVSKVAAVPGVRRAMAARQGAWAEAGDVVMEGRDIGSAVAPDAAVKIFLTAGIEERAARRAHQLGLATDESSLRELSESMAGRDRADAERSTSPFVMAPGAVVVDSTAKGIDEVVDEIAVAVRSALE